ncbi:MAG TPA: radical SAM protein [Methanospirillum sp.]|uniref:radical SAM protein n=1 Tax=Methanospirillum sp. TaxID=45200 RepID=UPI002C7AC48D|nr:radical SAM protein [Methanospirillum sp.]HWQ63658.1 radical SAM protein [Methanospirillum sp.]
MRNRPSSVHPLSIEEVFVLLQQIKEVIQEYLAYSSVVRPIIFWNLTGRCNLSCQHCYNSSGPDLEADTELSTKEALSFIDDCAELSVPVILFSGGEPLLRPDL